MESRYDGIADWYDTEFQPLPLQSETWDVLLRLLDGEPVGALIDVGCGTGGFAAGLVARGWEVTGTDVSEDMLRRAHAKGVRVVRADAASLPFADASFDGAMSVFTHTDLDDFRAVVGEVARVLRPATPFAYVGAHPCFVGPHSTYDVERGLPELHTGWYRRTGRYTEAPGISRSSDSLRMRVGASHLPLAAFLQRSSMSAFSWNGSTSPPSASTRTSLRCAGADEQRRSLTRNARSPGPAFAKGPGRGRAMSG